MLNHALGHTCIEYLFLPAMHACAHLCTHIMRHTISATHPSHPLTLNHTHPLTLNHTHPLTPTPMASEYSYLPPPPHGKQMWLLAPPPHHHTHTHTYAALAIAHPHLQLVKIGSRPWLQSCKWCFQVSEQGH